MVMVFATGHLSAYSREGREAIEHYLRHNIRGVDDANTQAWQRIVERIEGGEVVSFFNVVERDGSYHRRHMAIEGRIFAHQDCWARHELDAFRNWLKTGACFGRFIAVPGHGLQFEPSSLSYEECSDDQMRRFHSNAMAFLHTDEALERLWPYCAPEKRHQLLEAVLSNQDPDAPADPVHHPRKEDHEPESRSSPAPRQRQRTRRYRAAVADDA
jgi:hypothetical protein